MFDIILFLICYGIKMISPILSRIIGILLIVLEILSDCLFLKRFWKEKLSKEDIKNYVIFAIRRKALENGFEIVLKKSILTPLATALVATSDLPHPFNSVLCAFLVFNSLKTFKE